MTRYTHGHHDSVLRSHRWRTVENSAAYLIPHLQPGLDVLDVGSGPGTITLDIAGRVAPGHVIGVDAAADVVAAAAADAAADANVTFQTGDAYALDFPDASFDVVHTHQMLQHLDRPVDALREMGRVCRPGGVVAARDGDYDAMTWYPSEPALDRWMTMYQAVARANGGEPNAGRYLLRWALDAGFTEVTPSAATWCFATPDDRAWWAELWADRLTQSAIGRQAVELGAAAPADLEDMAAGWRRWAADPAGWFAVLHGEVICRR